MNSFSQPEVVPGDMVFWYPDPVSPNDPSVGWISKKPGSQTVSLLVWGESSGFVEKNSVRHKDDPFWRHSDTAQAWHRWGCWELHPSTKTLKEVAGMLTKMKVQAAKKPASSEG